ncbi:MAG: class IV adenylate cyclase [Treponema sp.]|uniref:class IV adenylate cyclase n=1 Tax=Treponema sp. TaxID=166 RepID=UPI00298DFCFF|nr:class IV adenylate cyclase [Treponema sp.]MBR5932763.1 class IV adenylate cyclase [Treponema sp.]
MFEIELKAHVRDKTRTVELVNSFAEFKGTTVKNDDYFNNSKITCRIRSEIKTLPDKTQIKENLFTYKSKELRMDKNGSSYEVNEENETTISNPEALEKLLLDSAYTKVYSKHKDVIEWITDTPFGQAHIELCNVPPLGDFLEIEIVTENCNNDKEINAELKLLIQKAGIDLNDIEKKYYSELLREAGVIH